ncbi:MAG TPA: hypothetical protein PLX02_00025 [Syntrophorhabdaceae bacterium]|nr:hypothetical protein [Syntrophorhabdaceae bacterium]HQM79984.1 hypothetical protein [Syntrophorhabdaceae bacterium]
MAKRWDLEEKMLIEVFGCSPVDKRIIEAFPGKDKEIVRSAFYHDGNGVEMALIEIFGCISLSNIIDLGAGRGAKKAQAPVVAEYHPTLAVGIA